MVVWTFRCDSELRRTMERKVSILFLEVLLVPESISLNFFFRNLKQSTKSSIAIRLDSEKSFLCTACLELRSTMDLTLWKKSFRVVYRSLRTKHVRIPNILILWTLERTEINAWEFYQVRFVYILGRLICLVVCCNSIQVPDRVAFGSQLTGVEIEAVDANGQVDRAMDGIAHNLTLDWNPNISVPLYRGVCTLPPIPMCNPGMWDGCVAHTQHSKLKTHISVCYKLLNWLICQLKWTEPAWQFSQCLDMYLNCSS